MYFFSRREPRFSIEGVGDGACRERRYGESVYSVAGEGVEGVHVAVDCVEAGVVVGAEDVLAVLGHALEDGEVAVVQEAQRAAEGVRVHAAELAEGAERRSRVAAT